jgi:uncharacterized phage protein (TIGR02220 family)
MIKPEFWSSEQVMNCSRDARLLFIGILNFADDGGVLRNSPKMLKAQIFPADDDVYINRVEQLICELILNKLLMQFESDGEQFFYIPKWDIHQKIDRPTFKFKKPSVDLIEDFLNSPINRRALDECSTSARRPLDTKIKENKGKENKGKENNTALRALSTSQSTTRKLFKNDAIEVLNFLNEKTGRFYRAEDSNIDLIIARLQSGITMQNLRAIIAKKCREWNDDVTMKKYLRPKTLFNKTNCEQYYGELNFKREIETTE